MKFVVTVARNSIESGRLEIEAECEDDARDQASQLLYADSGEIEWSGTSVPHATNVESVEEVH